MRKILVFIVVCVLTVLAACSSAPSYNPQAVKAIMEKAEKHEEFTQKDYSEMIDQLEAIVNELDKNKEKLKDMKAEDLDENPELAEMMGNYVGLSMLVAFSGNDLDDANKAKLKKFQEKAEAFDKE